MNAPPVPGAETGEHLMITVEGQRRRVARLVIAPSVFGAWSLIAHVYTPRTAHRLAEASLRTIVMQTEQLATQYPDLEIVTGYLSPEGVQGYQIEDVWVRGSWWPGAKRESMTFANAQELYLHLREGSYYNAGDCWIREAGDRRTRLYRDHCTVDSAKAWELVEYRIEHGTQTNPDLDLAAGTCPRCLSRYGYTPDHGVGFHCLECHYEHAD